MNLETKRTLSLTKAERKVLTDFYWNFYNDGVSEDMYDVLESIVENTRHPLYDINIVD